MKESRSEPFDKGVPRVSKKGREREHTLMKAYSFKKLDHSSTSEVHISAAIVPHPFQGVPTDTDASLLPQGARLVPQVPVVIKEKWVICNACEKWHLLPYGMDL